jgi:hypothetical protein
MKGWNDSLWLIRPLVVKSLAGQLGFTRPTVIMTLVKSEKRKNLHVGARATSRVVEGIAPVKMASQRYHIGRGRRRGHLRAMGRAPVA